MAVDGAAFLAAAVRAACLANAPRGTVQAVAAAVAGVFAHPLRQAAGAPGPDKGSQAEPRCEQAEGAAVAALEAQLRALRTARSTRRRKKRERRRAAKEEGSAAEKPEETAAAETVLDPPESSMVAVVPLKEKREAACLELSPTAPANKKMRGGAAADDEDCSLGLGEAEKDAPVDFLSRLTTVLTDVLAARDQGKTYEELMAEHSREDLLDEEPIAPPADSRGSGRGKRKGKKKI